MIRKIVLTGGPCAGKTTVLQVLKREFPAEIEIVPEVATMLLEGGFPVPGRDIDWSPEWQNIFQKAILPVQIQLERAYELKALQRGINLLVCDRGILDGAAYTPGGLRKFCQVHKIELSEALSRYWAVIHLESLSVGAPQLYGKMNNTNRFEDLQEAQKIEYATRECWRSHPRFYLIDCSAGLEGKISKTIQLIKEIL